MSVCALYYVLYSPDSLNNSLPRSEQVAIEDWSTGGKETSKLPKAFLKVTWEEAPSSVRMGEVWKLPYREIIVRLLLRGVQARGRLQQNEVKMWLRLSGDLHTTSTTCRSSLDLPKGCCLLRFVPADPQRERGCRTFLQTLRGYPINQVSIHSYIFESAPRGLISPFWSLSKMGQTRFLAGVRGIQS